MKLPLLPLFTLLFTFATLASAEEKTVIIFGDSITAGSAMVADERGQAWPRLLADQTKGRLHVIAQGKPGRTTNSESDFKIVLEKIPKAGIVVFALGTNDSNPNSDGVTPAVAHIKSMVEAARAAYGPSLQILIIGPTNINKDALQKRQETGAARSVRLKEINTAFEALAKEIKCDFLSLYDIVPASSLTNDGIHPDAAGNALMAKAIQPRLVTVK